MDGLSAAASIIAVLQISGQVFNLCRAYYSGVKDARQDITRLRYELIALDDVLTSVADLASFEDSTKLTTFRLLDQPEGPIACCHKDLRDLLLKLKHGSGSEKMRQFGLSAMKWPFSKGDVDTAVGALERHKSMFSFALTAD
jgi:ankyrin repeat domain-containing protein 50